jgi:hypothetical protein
LLWHLAPYIFREVAMTRFGIPLFALLAFGCTSYNEPLPATTMRTAAGTPVVRTSAVPVVTLAPGASASAGATAHRPGYGIIESISLVNPPTTASAGGSTPPMASGPYRFTLRMDDGRVQTLVVDNRAFLVGDRVQVLPDGKLIRA